MTETTIDTEWLDTHQWGIRASNDGESYNGFRWATLGYKTTSPDWNPRHECGGGLHYLCPEAHGFVMVGNRVELIETHGERVLLKDKAKSPAATIMAVNGDIPEEAFLRVGIRIAHDGDTVSPRENESWIVLGGTVQITGQTGGDCRAYDTATLNATGQTGGYCRASGTATLNATGQTGGDCRAYDTATLNATGQTGGYCRAYDTATLNATGQTGGDCRAYDTATLNATGQTGGDCRAYGTATLNATGQTGGYCWASDTATLNATGQTGGDCWAYGTATLHKT